MKAAVVGSFVVDLMARAPHLPAPGETVCGSLFRMGPGGKGSNQAIAARRAGCEVLFSTKLGRDPFSRTAELAFRENGLSEDYIFTTEEAPTGVALISVDDTTGQNSIVVVLGACETFGEADLARLAPALEGCAYLLLQLEINLDAVERLAELAVSRGVRVILNPAPVCRLPDTLYPRLDLITPNEVEASQLTGLPCRTPHDCDAIAEVFFRRGVSNVIITRGGQGLYLNDGSGGALLENYPVPAVDTTGAGDAFNGGLLAGLSCGKGLYEAAAFGNVVSNLAVTRLGTAPAMPYLEDIEAFIRENGLLHPRRIPD